jgi:hypothetical protein
MKTLEGAWKWYQQAKSQLELVRRIASHYWLDLPWEDKLDRDDRFKALVQEELEQDTSFTLAQIDDLGVLVLFSVFESLVRDLLAAQIETEIVEKSINHSVLLEATRDLIKQVEEGSFFKVLDPFKKLDPNLVEMVNQVRRYRNWVAHGKRGKKPPTVDPRMAYERLSEFWSLLANRSAEPDAQDRQ